MVNVEVCETFQALSEKVAAWRRAGERIALVPTMGALHEGHLSLVRIAKQHAQRVIVSIFVNPTQFAAHEDLAKYPRPFQDDVQALARLDTDLVFAPSNAAVYPTDFSTYIEPPAVAKPLEGLARPTHFRGVTTVVLKLLNATRADVAVFGQKDFQQVAVIRDMLRDLNHPCELVVGEITRDPDGLAMSSRNRFLTKDERIQALAIRRCLLSTRDQLRNGLGATTDIELFMRNELIQSGIDSIDYAVAVAPETLLSRTEIQFPIVLLIAARVGNTRLIDNELVEARD